MGYVRPLLKLVFEDPQLAGLQVRCRRLTLDELFLLGRMQPTPTGGMPAAEVLDAIYATIAAAVVEWNLEEEVRCDDDATVVKQPVPATREGVRTRDAKLVLALIEAMTQASADVSPPLEQPCNGGPPYPEASIPMQALTSPNPPS